MDRTTNTPVFVTRHSSIVIARRALTLVEMLIGMAITLLMMAAIVNLFANISSGVRIRRATMEMGSELRTVRATLFSDLAGATCRTLPWQRPDEDPGYIEIIEGRYSDSNPTGLALTLTTSQVPGSQTAPAGDMTDAMGLGDYDDILALTVQSEVTPFKGRYINAAGTQETIESNVAEVIWYAIENPVVGIGEPGMRNVYRRVLLVAPWADLSGIPLPSGVSLAEMSESYRNFYDICDVSVRIEQSSSLTGLIWVPNTLGDLTKRENRFGHFYNFATASAKGFPHYFPHDWATTPSPVDAGPGSSLLPLTGEREGEDLMLSNVLAFDLLVFDPGAPLFEYPLNSGAIIEPFGENLVNGGAFYSKVVTDGNLSGFGAYIDLGWDNNYDYTANANSPQTLFQEERQVSWHPNDPTANRGIPAVYDTWSYHYEHDGIDQDPGNANPALSNIVDQGANGLDDDGANGVDDIFERETSPPYPVPLRGMQVKLRIYDPGTRQIREASITRSFVPQ